jgi:hypothetical protein
MRAPDADQVDDDLVGSQLIEHVRKFVMPRSDYHCFGVRQQLLERGAQQ